MWNLGNPSIKGLVTEGWNLNSQKIIDKYLRKFQFFAGGGPGDIPNSGLKLRDEFKSIDAEIKI